MTGTTILRPDIYAVADFLTADECAALMAESEAARYEAVGLNERFRFCRYGPGQMFRWHGDGAYLRDDGAESRFTFLVSLNERY